MTITMDRERLVSIGENLFQLAKTYPDTQVTQEINIKK